MVRRLVLSLLVLPVTGFAGPKQDFMKAVEAQCGVSSSEASGFATPGRTGTVVQYKLCLKPLIRLSDSCSLKCKKKGSNIGK